MGSVVTPACLPGLMDTPDVDSIEQRNWKVADQIRAAGDVVIAVLTPESTRMRGSWNSSEMPRLGRLVVPIMNKANPRNDYAAARFNWPNSSGCRPDTPSCFVLPFDYAVETEMDFEIRAIDGDMSLMEYLRNLDVVEVKRRVYRIPSIVSLPNRVFLEHVEGLRNRLREVRASFERRALNLAVAYHAQPGEGMGKLIHEQIRAQRHAIVRGIARFNDAAFKHLEPVGGFVRRHVLRGSGRRVVPEAERLAELRETQRDRVKQIAMDFAAQLTEHARDMEPLAGGLVREGLDGLRVEEIAEHFPGHVGRCGPLLGGIPGPHGADGRAMVEKQPRPAALSPGTGCRFRVRSLGVARVCRVLYGGRRRPRDDGHRGAGRRGGPRAYFGKQVFGKVGGHVAALAAGAAGTACCLHYRPPRETWTWRDA